MCAVMPSEFINWSTDVPVGARTRTYGFLWRTGGTHTAKASCIIHDKNNLLGKRKEFTWTCGGTSNIEKGQSQNFWHCPTKCYKNAPGVNRAGWEGTYKFYNTERASDVSETGGCCMTGMKCRWI